MNASCLCATQVSVKCEMELTRPIDLPSTVPQVKSQVTHELDMAVLHIDSSTEAAHILSDVVAKYNGAHRRFSRATLAHQEHLSLLLACVHIADRLVVVVVAELGLPRKSGGPLWGYGAAR